MELENIIKDARDKLSDMLIIADDLEMAISKAEDILEQNRG